MVPGEEMQKRLAGLERFVCDLQADLEQHRAGTKRELSSIAGTLRCLEMRVPPHAAPEEGCAKDELAPWPCGGMAGEAKAHQAEPGPVAAGVGGKGGGCVDLAMLPALTEMSRLSLPAAKEADLCSVVRSALGELERLAQLAIRSLESVSPGHRVDELHACMRYAGDRHNSTESSTSVGPSTLEPNETDDDLNRTILKVENIPPDVVELPPHSLSGDPDGLPSEQCQAAPPSFRGDPPAKAPMREATLSPVRTQPPEREATLSPARTSSAPAGHREPAKEQ